MSRLLLTLDDLPPALRGGGVAIGNFDAVHVGHAALVRLLTQLAHRVGGPALVFTFDPPPGAILYPDRPRIKPLTWLTRRAELFGKLGVEAMIAYPTDRHFLQLSAREFFDQIIVQALAARAMVEGPNFHFGRGRQGDMALLQQWCHEAKIELSEIALVDSDSSVVSSTRIRELVTLGKLEIANQLLLEPYRLVGEVVSGAQRGRLIGFPTANLGSIPVLLPALGVYAGRVLGVDSSPWPAAIHIGPNPTFGENEPKVEVHLAGWQGSLYGRQLEVEVLHHVREIQKFPSVDELKAQLHRDVEKCVQLAQA
ncbi:MAG: riboflavin biosynthesis protein RibF [Pirellulaceae bacterium]|nr:riboflavin biosynthesis protein RibF [Pirellulaceae bacterium]